MANMEFLTKNILDTTTMITVDSNTATAEYLFNRLPNKQYRTVGYSGATSTEIVIDFGVTTSVSRIALQNHNLKQFRVFYNGTTANSITLDTGAATNTTSWATNSATNHYLMFSTIQVTSLTLQMDEAQTAVEKAVGEFWICDMNDRVDVNPSARNFRPDVFNKQVVHEMSDGGNAVYDIADKFRGQITFSYVDNAQRTAFRSIYDAKDDFCYVPFGTGTAWDGYIWNVVWVGGFEFVKPQGNNYAELGWTGKIRLGEVAL